MISEAPNNRGAGNIRYLAPERFNPASSDMRRTAASDVYAFACVCLLVSLLSYTLAYIQYLRSIQLYTMKHPFHQYREDVTVIMQVVLNQRPARQDQEFCHPMTDVMWQLVEDAWNQDPAARPSMLHLEERLRSMTTVNPPRRRRSSNMSSRSLSHWELVRLSNPQASGSDADPPTFSRTQPLLVSSAAAGVPGLSRFFEWYLRRSVPDSRASSSPRSVWHRILAPNASTTASSTRPNGRKVYFNHHKGEHCEYFGRLRTPGHD
jgi:serine/threonine protein kinase